MRMLIGLISVLALLLGLLWLLQGLGVVHVQPILCFADCEPIQKPSVVWAVVGGILAVAGAVMILRVIREYKLRPK